jgi:hypothetical protein
MAAQEIYEWANEAENATTGYLDRGTSVRKIEFLFTQIL